jgi:hypothetical protein
VSNKKNKKYTHKIENKPLEERNCHTRENGVDKAYLCAGYGIV